MCFLHLHIQMCINFLFYLFFDWPIHVFGQSCTMPLATNFELVLQILTSILSYLVSILNTNIVTFKQFSVQSFTSSSGWLTEYPSTWKGSVTVQSSKDTLWFQFEDMFQLIVTPHGIKKVAIQLKDRQTKVYAISAKLFLS